MKTAALCQALPVQRAAPWLSCAPKHRMSGKQQPCFYLKERFEIIEIHTCPPAWKCKLPSSTELKAGSGALLGALQPPLLHSRRRQGKEDEEQHLTLLGGTAPLQGTNPDLPQAADRSDLPTQPDRAPPATGSHPLKVTSWLCSLQKTPPCAPCRLELPCRGLWTGIWL